MSENFLEGSYSLKMYDSVPEKMPSICLTLSPVSVRVLSVDRMGRPAPTVAS